LYVSLSTVACGSGGAPGGIGGSEGIGGSAGGAVATPDASAGGAPGPGPDAAVVVTPDAAVVVTPDAAVVVTPDAAVVVTPDAAVVVTPDAAIVATPDAVIVATPDAAVAPPEPDAAVVVTPDAAPVITPDAAVVPPEPDAAVVPPADPFAGSSDEFDDAATLRARWQIRHEVENTPPQFTLFDIDQSNDGQLTIQPTVSGWYGTSTGPYLYQTVRGDILLETSLVAGRVGLVDIPPTQPFNSGGIVLRDPVHGPGADNWVMVNIGHQAQFVGTETKTTTDSASVLLLDDAPHRGRLRLCRVGTTYVMARFLSNDAGWREIRRYERPDLPDEVQLGLVTNGWNSQGERPNANVAPDLYARFDYARFRRPVDLADCLSEP
jgi:hypothetical protein